MGLPVQTFDLQFLKGLQTKTDPKLQLQGELLECENAVFDRLGRLDKRPGFASFPTTLTNGGSFSGSFPLRSLGTFKDQLVTNDGSTLYSYSDGLDQWSSVGSMITTRTSVREVHQDNYQQLNPAVAYSAGIEVHVFESSQPYGGAAYSAMYKVIDSATGATLTSTRNVSVGYTKPKVHVLGSYFVITAILPGSNLVSWWTLPIATPTATLTSRGNITTAFHATNSFYDSSVSTNYVHVAYVNTSNEIKYKNINASLTVSSEFTHDNTSRTWQFISTWTDSLDRLWLADCYDDGGGNHVARTAIYTSAGATTLASTTVGTVSDTPGLYRMAGVSNFSFNGYGSFILLEQNASSTRNILTYKAFLDPGGSVTTAAEFKRSVGIACKPFLIDSGEQLAVLAHESELQTTYFVYNNSGYLVSRFLSGRAGGMETDKYCAHVATKATNTYLLPITIKSAVHSETDVFFSLLGAGVCELELDPAQGARYSELGDNLIITAGNVYCFDGTNCFEQSFHLYPEGASGVASNGSGLLTVSSEYRYRFIYSHMDSNGNVHRSTTSVPLQVTTGGTDDTITLTIPTLRLTSRNDVTIDVYRTTAGGSIYYRLTGVSDQLYNAPSNDTVSYVDEYADSEITGNEPLYTAGGELDNSAPCSSLLSATFKNRVWLADTEQPNSIWFSKLNAQNEPVNFSDLQTMRVPAMGGALQDLIPFGEMLVIANESALQVLTGEGPNNTGGPGVNGEQQYLTPQCLTRDVGVKYPGVWCEIPQGIVFPSNKGIQLLDRSGALQFIGAPVSAYDGYSFVAAVCVPDKNRAIFFSDSSSGVALSYDWFAGQWATFTNTSLFPNMRDAVAWNNSIVMVNSGSGIYQCTGSVYTDNSASINLMAGTGWYAPAGPQGYVQLHKIAIECDYYAAHRLTVDIFYDYDENKKRTLQIRPDTITTTTGDTKRNQYVFTINDKCKAFRLRIRSASDTGQAVGFNSISAQIAGLPGFNRLPSVHKR